MILFLRWEKRWGERKVVDIGRDRLPSGKNEEGDFMAQVKNQVEVDGGCWRKVPWVDELWYFYKVTY